MQKQNKKVNLSLKTNSKVEYVIFKDTIYNSMKKYEIDKMIKSSKCGKMLTLGKFEEGILCTNVINFSLSLKIFQNKNFCPSKRKFPEENKKLERESIMAISIQKIQSRPMNQYEKEKSKEN